MNYYNPLQFVIVGNEPLWFIVGLVTGSIVMAIIDFIIDRIGD